LGYYFRAKLSISWRGWRILKQIDSKYTAHLIDDIKDNQYCFTDGIGTMGLGVAKEIAKSIGIKMKSDVRIFLIILYDRTLVLSRKTFRRRIKCVLQVVKACYPSILDPHPMISRSKFEEV
jgi:hypothetical protein